MNILNLDLPKLPEEIITKVRLFANQLGFSNNRDVFNQCHNYKINSVNYDFNQFTEIDDEINQLYGNYFNEKLYSIVGVMRNVTNNISEFPPHCDRYRKTAINFLIDNGGENVVTRFYDFERSDNDDLSKGENLKYSQINFVSEHKLEPKNWYAFNVQKCHSVNNIESTRLLFGLVLESNQNYKTFKSIYG